MKRTAPFFAATLCLAAAAAGCGGGHARASTTTAPADPSSAPASTTSLPEAPTTTALDTSVVPPVITIAYVQAVLDQLDHVYGDAVRLEVATQSFPPTAANELRAIYGGVQYRDELAIFSQALSNGSVTAARSNPGDPVTLVQQLDDSSSSCIQAAITFSYPTGSTSAKPLSVYVVLRPVSAGTDAPHYNPTPWWLTYEQSGVPSESDACEP